MWASHGLRIRLWPKRKLEQIFNYGILSNRAGIIITSRLIEPLQVFEWGNNMAAYYTFEDLSGSTTNGVKTDNPYHDLIESCDNEPVSTTHSPRRDIAKTFQDQNPSKIQHAPDQPQCSTERQAALTRLSRRNGGFDPREVGESQRVPRLQGPTTLSRVLGKANRPGQEPHRRSPTPSERSCSKPLDHAAGQFAYDSLGDHAQSHST